jgi:predicted nucleotidyltransferase component of viral defense system
MLTTTQIKDLAIREHTSPINIAREYCQHLFLSALYQEEKAQKLYFKGGTALRLLYRSPRFSEDLDFDSPQKHDIAGLEATIVAALGEIEARGITTELQEAKTTTGGYLAVAIFSLPDYRITSQLEISLRNGTSKREVATIENNYLPTYTVVQLAEAQLVAGKIKALLVRRKPRDFYDVYFMLRSRLLPAEQRSLLPDVLAALQEAKPNFEEELKQFLPQSHWMMIKDLPMALEREIKRFV